MKTGRTLRTAIILSLAFMIAATAEYLFSNDREPPLILKLEIVQEEHSKDSATVTDRVSIIGRDVAYWWEGFGFRRDGRGNHRYRLSPEGYGSLVRYITTNRLNRDLKEERPYGKIGLSISLRLNMIMNGVKTSAFLKGMYNEWGAKQERRCNLESIDFFRRCKHIARQAKNKSDRF